MTKVTNSMYTPNFSYTYPGKLNEDLVEVPQVGTPALSDLFRIKQGVRCGEYVNLMQPLSTVVTKSTGDCAPTYTQAGTITDRKLETGSYDVNLSWCKKEFQAVCNVLGDSALIGDGLSGYELGGRLRTAIFNMVTQTMKKDAFKHIFLSDNSLGSGSTNPYSAIDGVFVKFLDAAAGYCVQLVSDAFPNTHNSTLATNQARDVLRQLWGSSKLLLKQLPNNQKVFWVTGSVWENYMDSVINDCCVEGSWRAGQDGIDRLYYRGIELLPLWVLDEALESDTTNPFYDEIRHFIVYTMRDNHLLGVENSSDLNRLEMCYDCVTKTTYIQGEYRLGYNFALCDYISWAK